MRVVYLLSILLCSHAFSHPSKRQDQADGALDEWFLPPLDWPDTDFEGQSVGEPARRDPSGNTGPEKDDSAELDTSPKAIGLHDGGADISVRQGEIRWTDHLFTALIAWGAVERGKAFYDLVNDCKEWADGDGDSGVDCVFGAVGTLLFLAASAVKIKRGLTVLGQRLDENGIGIPGLPGGRAPLAPHNNGKRAAILQMEDLLSTGLGTQVHHIGNWKRARSALHIRGDDDNNEYDEHSVFGLEVSGVPMHLTHIYNENTTQIVLGNGPGPETPLNKRRLEGRASQKYNNQYFDSDGLMMLSQTDPFGQSSPEMYADPENAEDYEFLVDLVKCYMTDTHPFATVFGGVIHRDSIMDGSSLQFQMYNDYDKVNLAAGEIVTLDDGISFVDQMSIEGGLRVNPRCTKGH